MNTFSQQTPLLTSYNIPLLILCHSLCENNLFIIYRYLLYIVTSHIASMKNVIRDCWCCRAVLELRLESSIAPISWYCFAQISIKLCYFKSSCRRIVWFENHALSRLVLSKIMQYIMISFIENHALSKFVLRESRFIEIRFIEYYEPSRKKRYSEPCFIENSAVSIPGLPRTPHYAPYRDSISFPIPSYPKTLIWGFLHHRYFSLHKPSRSHTNPITRSKSFWFYFVSGRVLRRDLIRCQCCKWFSSKIKMDGRVDPHLLGRKDQRL